MVVVMGLKEDNKKLKEEVTKCELALKKDTPEEVKGKEDV